jgi:YD repeat-containing protein
MAQGSPRRIRLVCRIAAMRSSVSLAICAVMLAANAAAQTVFDQNGFGGQHGTYSVLPYEHVDPLTCNLLLVVTDLSLPGNASLGISVQRVYNSAVYPDYESNSLELEEDSWAGIGWRLHFGRVLHEDSTSGGGTEIEMGDGSRHKLYHTSARPEGWITKDFWVYDKNTHTLKLPNGIVYTFGRAVFLNPRLGTVRYVTEIRDPFNNTITFTYFGAGGPPDGVQQIRQVLASDQIREINFTYDAALKSLASMTYDGHTWTYGHQAFGPAGFSALTSVQPPAGKPWTYTYESTPGYVGLASMLVPGGGVVSYTYGDATRYAGAITRRERVVTQRTISGHQITAGTWTFTYSDGPNKDQTVVACPCGTTRYRYLGIGLSGSFNAWLTGLLAERTTESGNGTVMERETLTWQASEAVSPDAIPAEGGLWGDPAVSNALLQTRTMTRGNQSWATDFEYHTGLGNYNDYGRPWRITETGEFARITTRTFQYGFTPYIIDRTATEDIKIGAEIASSSWSYTLANGFMTQQRPFGVLTTFEALANGNVGTVIDANNNRTDFQYRWGAVSRVATPMLITTREIDPSGVTLSETTGSLTTRYEYDLAFRIKRVIPPGNPAPPGSIAPNPITYEYDGLHQEWMRVARGAAQTSQQFDGFGRVISTTDRVDLKTRLTRDACGRVTFQSAPYTTGAGTRGVETTYDALNRVTSTKAVPDNSTTSYSYGTTYSQKWDAEGRRTRYDFKATGHPDARRLTGVTIGVSTDLSQTTKYSYDVLGNLIQVQSPSPSVPNRVWSYDSHGWPLNDRQPESGLTQYQHDSAGRLTQITDDTGAITIYGYDNNNRLISRNAPGTDGDVTYGYDTQGRLSTITVGGVVTTYRYDWSGRLSQREDAIDGRTFTSTYGYDENDNLTSVVYPAYPASRRTVTYAYDIENRLTTPTMARSSASAAWSTGAPSTRSARRADRCWRSTKNSAGSSRGRAIWCMPAIGWWARCATPWARRVPRRRRSTSRPPRR